MMVSASHMCQSCSAKDLFSRELPHPDMEKSFSWAICVRFWESSGHIWGSLFLPTTNPLFLVKSVHQNTEEKTSFVFGPCSAFYLPNMLVYMLTSSLGFY